MKPAGITGWGAAALLSASLIAAGPAAAVPAAPGRDGPLFAVTEFTPQQPDSGGGTSISGNGRYVVFVSDSGSYVPGDTNGAADIFVRDLWTRTTSRVSVSSTGEQTPPQGEGFGYSGGGSISADGRFVAFWSSAGNLVPDQLNGAGAIFVRDRWAGTTRLVSVDIYGTPLGPDSYEEMISADGRYVVFSYLRLHGGVADVYRYDVRTSTTRLLRTDTTWSESNIRGPQPRISADGRYVAFTSDAALTPGDTNGVQDVFVHDFAGGTTRKVSRSHTGGQTTADSLTGAISADGRHVVFGSTDATVVPGDTNGVDDVFVHDLRTGSTRRVSVSGTGVQANQMSAWIAVSGDGRLVGFASAADNLVAGDTNGHLDIFVHDRRTAGTVQISKPNGGGKANGESLSPLLSADGRVIAFTSAAGNLIRNANPGGTYSVYARSLP